MNRWPSTQQLQHPMHSHNIRQLRGLIVWLRGLIHKYLLKRNTGWLMHTMCHLSPNSRQYMRFGLYQFLRANIHSVANSRR